jgi:hypothetical protein
LVHLSFIWGLVLNTITQTGVDETTISSVTSRSGLLPHDLAEICLLCLLGLLASALLLVPGDQTAALLEWLG